MSGLVLASTSRYRRELVERLALPFTVQRPEVDETPRPGESPLALARRLAEAKARAVAATRPDDWVIGSDQVAEREGRPVGKPGSAENAVAQLMAASGREQHFHTAFCLFRQASGGLLAGEDLTVVRFRTLDPEEVRRYVAIESPLDCAGSFKCEGLGISLFEAIQTRDPTALVGLPLIALSSALRRAGFRLP
ncbi:MAG TPA: Maf family nucleotide pyrophosphatase [Arenimonas sp.]|nr:Maf family nucleotide pyrophosphatase [Arenimonas sp.]